MALIDEFFAEFNHGRFYEPLGRLLGGAGVSSEGLSAAFPEDLEGWEERFEGVEISHHVFKEKARVPRSEFFARLRRESDEYLRKFPHMAPVVERLWRLSAEDGRVECAFRSCRTEPSELMRLCVQRLNREGAGFLPEASLILETFDAKNGAFMDGSARAAESWREPAAAAAAADGVRVLMTGGVMLELLKAPSETALVLHLPRKEVEETARHAHASQRLAGLLLDLRKAAGAGPMVLPSRLALTVPADWRLEDGSYAGTLMCVGAGWKLQEGEKDIPLDDGAVLRTRLPVKASPSA